MSNGIVAADQLRLFIERIERLEEEKKGIADDIKDVYAEAKSNGYDAATMRDIIKLRKMDKNVRREREALLDTYKAALGMLDGTPLGRWAMDRLKKKQDEHSEGDVPAEDGDEGYGDGGAASTREAEPAVPELPESAIEGARDEGSAAAKAGKPVADNPYPARDLRRAAWDEAWCAELGSDGMDIPDAWKPDPKKKPEKTEGAA